MGAAFAPKYISNISCNKTLDNYSCNIYNYNCQAVDLTTSWITMIDVKENNTMKKILIVNASKRRNGNSYALAKRFAEQLEGKAEVVTFNIGEKAVNACLACDACKRQHTPNCIQKDDFTALIPEIDSCDAMLILAPVHWDQFPAQLKAFLDRTYSFMDFTQPDLSMAGRKDKKVAGYFFAGFGPVDVYTNMVETNIKSFATAGFIDYKAHVAGDANVPGSILEKEDDLKVADEFAEWLLA